MLIIALSAAPALAAAAQPAQSPGCANFQFPVQLSMAGSLQGFAGQYSDGVREAALRQDGYRVLLRLDGTAERQLRLAGEWRFVDGCGTAYQFTLPLDGVGANLEIIGRGAKPIRLKRVRREHD